MELDGDGGTSRGGPCDEKLDPVMVRAEAEPETTTRLRNLAIKCRGRLQRLCEQEDSDRAAKKAEAAVFWASHQSAEFALWCLRVGVDRQGSGSLDRRLKDVPAICDVFDKLLQALDSDLAEFEKPPARTISTPPRSIVARASASEINDNNSDSSSSLSFDSLSSFDGSEGQVAGLGEVQERQAALRKAIEKTIERLRQHAMWISQAAIKHRQDRMELYLKKDGPSSRYEAYKKMAEHAARKQYTLARVFFIERIAESFARRRTRFDYLKEHQRKRARDDLLLPGPPTSRHDSRAAVAAPAAVFGHTQAQGAKAQLEKPQTVYQSTILSKTVVTQLKEPPGLDLHKRAESVASVVTRRAEFPPPPKITGSSFECPYCRLDLSTSDAEMPRWTQHVMEDFEPYFCTEEACQRPFSFPNTFDGLMAHLQTHVPVRYHLDTPSGKHMEADHEDELEGQIPSVHTDQPLLGDSLSALKNSTRRRGVFIFRTCPFCGGYPEVLEKGFGDPSNPESQEELRYHIKEHMQQIMLFLPPDREDLTGGGDNVEASTSTERESVRETNRGEAEDIPMLCSREECDCQEPAQASLPDLEADHDFWIEMLKECGKYDRSDVSTDYFLRAECAELEPFISRWKSQHMAENEMAQIPTMSVSTKNTNIGGSAQVTMGNINFLLAGEAAPKSHRVIPFDRNPDVVARSSIFAELETLLPPSPNGRSAALWGLGGSGKTQVALEYAWRRAEDPACSVFWVHADDEATFAQSYKKVAEELGLEDAKGEKLLEEVKQRIQAEPCWVLVLDNADNLRLFGVGRAEAGLLAFVPHSATGTVLWASRDELVSRLVGVRRSINVARMTDEEAMTLFETAWGRTIGDEMDDAKALLSELDRLPLAISQSAAYLRQTDMPIKGCLSKLRDGQERWDVLKQSRFDRHRRVGVPNSILETWAISIEQIRVENSMAYNILHVQVFLDNENIPFELIQKAATLGDGDCGDEETVRKAAARLRHFSFFAEHTDGLIYDMPKLIQEAARHKLRKEDAAHFARAALRVMTDLFPKPNDLWGLWDPCEKYLAHAQRAGEWAELSGQAAETATLLMRISHYLHNCGRWRENESVDIKAYELRKKALGDRHPDTIWSMAGLAATYHAQGRYDDAEKIYRNALALRREVLGERHPDTIRSMGNLAATYYAQGRHDDAEEIYQDALKLQREVLGERHPDTLLNMHYLAQARYELGRKKEAVEMMEKCYEQRCAVLGADHPDTRESERELSEWKGAASEGCTL
ncbi:hypothetical protein RB595_009726 [Gaeumannomyces hyphopodioides]